MSAKHSASQKSLILLLAEKVIKTIKQPLQARANCTMIFTWLSKDHSEKTYQVCNVYMLVLRRESRKATFYTYSGVHFRVKTHHHSRAGKKVLASNLPVGWALLLQDKLLNPALILDPPTYGVF